MKTNICKKCGGMVLFVHKIEPAKYGLAYVCNECGDTHYKSFTAIKKIKTTKTKKHILSKDCWCNPKVIAFDKLDEDRVFNVLIDEIAKVFGGSLNNTQYVKLLHLLKFLLSIKSK
jgi:uncharacterized Zn finger protein